MRNWRYNLRPTSYKYILLVYICLITLLLVTGLSSASSEHRQASPSDIFSVDGSYIENSSVYLMPDSIFIYNGFDPTTQNLIIQNSAQFEMLLNKHIVTYGVPVSASSYEISNDAVIKSVSSESSQIHYGSPFSGDTTVMDSSDNTIDGFSKAAYNSYSILDPNSSDIFIEIDYAEPSVSQNPHISHFIRIIEEFNNSSENIRLHFIISKNPEYSADSELTPVEYFTQREQTHSIHQTDMYDTYHIGFPHTISPGGTHLPEHSNGYWLKTEDDQTGVIIQRFITETSMAHNKS